MKTTNYLAGLAAITMTFTGMAAPISAYADDSSSVSSTEYAIIAYYFSGLVCSGHVNKISV